MGDDLKLRQTKRTLEPGGAEKTAIGVGNCPLVLIKWSLFDGNLEGSEEVRGLVLGWTRELSVYLFAWDDFNGVWGDGGRPLLFYFLLVLCLEIPSEGT